MSDKIYLRRGNRTDLPSLAVGEPGFAIDTGELFIGSSFGNLPIGNATRSNITFYLSPTGNDLSGGLSTSTPLKTFAGLKSRLVQCVNHDVSVVIVAGTYAENALVSGLYGSGSLTFTGGTDTTTAVNYLIYAITVKNCLIPITFNFLKLYATDIDTATVINSKGTKFLACLSVNGSASAGFVADQAEMEVNSCQISFRSNAVVSKNQANAFSAFNTGSSNTTGLNAFNGGEIVKASGAQAGATTAETTTTGGLIR